MWVPLGLAHLARSLYKDPTGFLKVPVLVWEAPPGSGDHLAEDWAPTNAGLAPARPRAGEPVIFPIEKIANSKNPFAMGVTIGRVETNDIAIDDASVSRFHAWLQHDDRLSAWFLTDAESKNGTWLGEAKLAPSTRTRLTDGSTIRLGDIHTRFLMPDSLLKWVREKSAGLGSAE
jgi:hypothetical protein